MSFDLDLYLFEIMQVYLSKIIEMRQLNYDDENEICKSCKRQIETPWKLERKHLSSGGLLHVIKRPIL